MTFDISKIIIPTNPGIYLMKDDADKIIYIGKAKNLKNRVRSYFNKNQNYKTQKLVENIFDIEFVLTDNESEAFLLESNMIKKYRPRFLVLFALLLLGRNLGSVVSLFWPKEDGDSLGFLLPLQLLISDCVNLAFDRLKWPVKGPQFHHNLLSSSVQ